MRRFLFILFIFLLAILVFSIVLFLLINNKGKGALQITSNPNSKVYLDDKLIGTTPLCKCDAKGMITEGYHIIKMVEVSGNFDTFVQKITIAPKILTVVDKNFAQKGLDSASIITLTQIEGAKDAKISLTTFPQGAQVFIDNSLQGKSPMILDNIKESDHELRFTREGYRDKIVRIRTVLGFRLDAIIYLGLNPDVVSTSSNLIISSTSAKLIGQKVIILDTPTGFLRVRQDSSLSSAEVSQVIPGETYALIEEALEWFKIKLSNGTEGWISSRYAEKIN